VKKSFCSIKDKGIPVKVFAYDPFSFSIDDLILMIYFNLKIFASENNIWNEYKKNGTFNKKVAVKNLYI